MELLFPLPPFQISYIMHFLFHYFGLTCFLYLWGQLFFQRDSLLKFASVRCTKDSKPSYCLACLFSLVEQVTNFTKPDMYNLLNNLGFLI